MTTRFPDATPARLRPDAGRGRVVLLSYHFPPDRTVGAIRPARLAHALASSGYDVRVVTAERAEDDRREQTLAGPIRVRPVRMLPSLRATLLTIMREFGFRSAAVGAGVPWNPDLADLERGQWKRILNSFLWIPDDLQGFILPALWAVLDEVRPGDLLYCSGPPFSAHVVGWLAHLVARTRWIAEFRDPWTDNPAKPPFVRSGASDRVERWLEQRVLASAAGIVAVTPAVGGLLRAKLSPSGPSRVTVSMTGIDHLRSHLGRRRPGPIRIVYTGNLYLGRDPRPFFLGLAQARRTLALRSTDVRVDFIGDCRSYRGVAVQAMADEAGVGDLVNFSDWMPPWQCRRAQEEADLLLLLANGQPLQVPNKLYEYFGTRRPILAFVDPGGACANMLEQVGGHFSGSGEAPDLVVRAIAAAMAGDGDPPRGDPVLLHSWSASDQIRQLVEWMDGLS